MIKADILKTISIEQVVEVWEEVDKMKVTIQIANVREMISNEFELRDSEAFEKWIDQEYEQGKTLSPKEFFIK